jgi:hypothetical protein
MMRLLPLPMKQGWPWSLPICAISGTRRLHLPITSSRAQRGNSERIAQSWIAASLTLLAMTM